MSGKKLSLRGVVKEQIHINLPIGQIEILELIAVKAHMSRSYVLSKIIEGYIHGQR